MAAPTIETAIWLALKARVQALVLSPVFPVAWPNEAFSKPSTGGYLRVTHVPNMNRRLFIGSIDPHQRLGLLQVDVFMPKNQNVAVALEVAGKVAAHFSADLRMAYGDIAVRVQSAPTVAQPIDDDTHLLVPVTVPVECFA